MSCNGLRFFASSAQGIVLDSECVPHYLEQDYRRSLASTAGSEDVVVG